MKRTALFVLLLYLPTLNILAQQTPSSAPSRKPTYKLIDLTPDFWQFWAKAEKLSVPDQAKLFREMVADRHPEVYKASVINLDEKKPLDTELSARYATWHELLAPRMSIMRRVSGQISTDLPRYETNFQKAFPDMNYTGEVYFLCSLGGFDGATRTVAGKTALLFGIDMIAYVYGNDADPQPFFHHELFHIYHSQFLPDTDDDPIYRNLWREGLAEYVAKSLNPSAAGVTLFGLPLDMPQRAQAMLPALAHDLRLNLDSTSQDVREKYFFGMSSHAGVPPRSGYYVGYLVAQKIGAGKQLQDLAKITGTELRKQVEQALLELEKDGK